MSLDHGNQITQIPVNAMMPFKLKNSGGTSVNLHGRKPTNSSKHLVPSITLIIPGFVSSVGAAVTEFQHPCTPMLWT